MARVWTVVVMVDSSGEMGGREVRGGGGRTRIGEREREAGRERERGGGAERGEIGRAHV